MTRFQSDAEFKTTLCELPVERQREVGRLFVQNVLGLSDNPVIDKMLAAHDPAGMTDAEVAAAFKTAKSAAIESYTLCGHEGDWLKQASHFVAAATAACFTPAERTVKCSDIAWSAAMNARMARVSEHVAGGTGTGETETANQYGILEKYLANS